MPRESVLHRRERSAQILAALGRAYPNAHCELNHNSPFQLLIATILSAQSTDRQVNVVTVDLFRKYPTARDFAESPPANLAEDLRRIGLYRNKARNIQACCRALVDRHGGEVPRTMAELTALAGVGRKTANVVLGTAFGLNLGIVVDTHVARLAGRLGLNSETSPEKIEQALLKLIPVKKWTAFSHWLIWHGRRRCSARRPDCPGCELSTLCPSATKLIHTCRSSIAS